MKTNSFYEPSVTTSVVEKFYHLLLGYARNDNYLLFSCLLFVCSCSGTHKSQANSKADSIQEKPVEVKKVIVEPAHAVSEEKNYTIHSFSTEGDVLSIIVTYKGGCGTHSFELYSNGFLKKSLPPQVDVFLEHSKENETCTEEVKQTLKFDISALKKPGYNLIVININSADNKLDWKVQ